MPTLTIEAIRENPWHVMTHRLPSNAPQLLLELAFVAATYCRTSEAMLMMAAREGRYTPSGWEPNDEHPDVHEECEARCHSADEKLRELLDLT